MDNEQLPAGYRAYTKADRREQLRDLAATAEQLANLAEEHDLGLGAEYHDIAVRANELLGDGFDQNSLTTLSSEYPQGPDWTHPRWPESDPSWEPWQVPFRELHTRGRLLALELRVLATKA